MSSQIIREFTVAELKELDFPWCVVADEAYESSRWMEFHEAIILMEDDGYHYAINYQQGLTEYQETDYDDMFFDNPVQAVRVEQVPVTVLQWKPVAEETN